MVDVLELKKVSKEFGKKLVLNKVSFKVKKGEIFGLIGMSGSGKTTILNLIIGFLAPSDGTINYKPSDVLDNDKEPLKDMSDNLRDVKQNFGFAPQDPSYYPRLTVKENLTYYGKLYNIISDTVRKNMNNLLKITRMTPQKDVLAEHLSGGMQRRLSIACSLIHNPYILILDEPTADLDPVLREETWRLIREINKQGTTVIIASHFLEELEAICDRIAIIKKGSVLETGSLDEIKKEFSKGKTEVSFRLKNENKKIVSEMKRKYSARIAGKSIHVSTTKPRELIRRLARELKSNVSSVEVHPPTLREVFNKLSRK